MIGLTLHFDDKYAEVDVWDKGKGISIGHPIFSS